MRKKRSQRKGAATVEFAICAPVLLIIGFGFVNVGVYVQLKHQSKMIGHLAATEVFKAETKDASTISGIEVKFRKMAAELGIDGFSLEVDRHSSDVAVVKTGVSVTANYSIPTTFVTSNWLATETFVFSRLD